MTTTFQINLTRRNNALRRLAETQAKRDRGAFLSSADLAAERNARRIVKGA